MIPAPSGNCETNKEELINIKYVQFKLEARTRA